MKPKIKQRSKSWPVVGCLVAVLLPLSPLIWMFGAMLKAVYDVKHLKSEIQRTVNPDELRAWIFTQTMKHPEGGYVRESAEEWPAHFPQFSAGDFSVSLPATNSNGKPQDVLMATLVWWTFGHGLKVTVFLNADGTPVDVGEEATWAKGVFFDRLHK